MQLALLMAVLFGVALLTWTTVAYLCNTKIADLRIEHVRHIQEIHKDYAMRDRVYGAVPIERIIGYEDFTEGFEDGREDQEVD